MDSRESEVSGEFMEMWRDDRFSGVRQNFQIGDIVEITESSLLTLLWSDGRESGEIWDIAKGDRLRIAKDVLVFLSGIDPDDVPLVKAIGMGQIGHDITLTRNGEGSGFWSRGHGSMGDRLSKLAESLLPANIDEQEDGSGLCIIVM